MNAADIAKVMPDVARHFWGEPNRRHSKKTELRWGNNGARSVDVAKGTWFDFEANEGGGVLDFLKRESVDDPWAWLREHGYGNGNDNDSNDRKIVAIYDYADESGKLLFQVVRLRPKTFRQRRPDGRGGWIWNLKGVTRVLYRLPELIEALALERRVFVVEGEKDVETLARHGITATCNSEGVKKWRPDFADALAGADVIVIPDNDDDGRNHAHDVARSLVGKAARIRVLELPDLVHKGDVSDWFTHGGTVEALTALAAAAPDWAEAKHNGREQPCTINETLVVFDRWLILPDQTPVLAVLGTIAANLLPGDPVWLGLIGPPSSAKTEILNSTSMLPNVVPAATLTPAGLLSGTPKKQQAAGTKGGLLRQIGDFGIIVLKDFGSILSMRPDSKAEVLAALRELYDGAWTRHLGTDGGRMLTWTGKVGLLFGATGVIDSHYGVIGAMGDRFLLTRLAPAGQGQFNRALEHAGAATGQMRRELAQTVANLFAGRRAEPRKIDSNEIERIDRVISKVVRLRGAVERDRQSREIEAIYGAEGTARIGLCLERLLAGLDTLGIERERALDVVEKVALDSVPPIRRRAYEFLEPRFPATATTTDVAQALGLPSITARRALEDLAAYGLIDRLTQGSGKADEWVACR